MSHILRSNYFGLKFDSYLARCIQYVLSNPGLTILWRWELEWEQEIDRARACESWLDSNGLPALFGLRASQTANCICLCETE